MLHCYTHTHRAHLQRKLAARSSSSMTLHKNIRSNASLFLKNRFCRMICVCTRKHELIMSHSNIILYMLLLANRAHANNVNARMQHMYISTFYSYIVRGRRIDCTNGQYGLISFCIRFTRQACKCHCILIAPHLLPFFHSRNMHWSPDAGFLF